MQVTTVDVLMFWCPAMAQSAEYPFDELTDVILLYGEAEHNRAVTARPLHLRPNMANAGRPRS
jgi:hypothetical protein